MNESEQRTHGLWPLIFVIYFFPFFAIVVDEAILKTFWFSGHLPAAFGEVMRALYPFHKLLH